MPSILELEGAYALVIVWSQTIYIKFFYNHLYPGKEFFILTSNAMDIQKNGTEIAYKEDTWIGFSLILC